MDAKHEILFTNPRWREVARLRIAGHTLPEIATILSMGRNTAAAILDSPEGQAHLARLQDRLDEELVRSMVYGLWADRLSTGNSRNKRRHRLTY